MKLTSFMMRRSIQVLLFVSLTPGSVSAEEIHLKDGTKITGRVVGISDDSFQIKTSYGEIKVPRSDIISISFPENQPKKEEEKLRAIDEELNDTTYVNRTGGFEMVFPKGWKLFPEMRRGANEVVGALAAGDETLFVMITPEDYSGTLKTYAALVELQLQTQFKDYSKLSEKPAKIDGRNGVLLVMRAVNTAANNTPMKFGVFIIPYDGKMVRLTFLTVEPLFDDAVATIVKIAESYRSQKKS